MAGGYEIYRTTDFVMLSLIMYSFLTNNYIKWYILALIMHIKTPFIFSFPLLKYNCHPNESQTVAYAYTSVTFGKRRRLQRELLPLHSYSQISFDLENLNVLGCDFNLDCCVLYWICEVCVSILWSAVLLWQRLIIHILFLFYELIR